MMDKSQEPIAVEEDSYLFSTPDSKLSTLQRTVVAVTRAITPAIKLKLFEDVTPLVAPSTSLQDGDSVGPSLGSLFPKINGPVVKSQPTSSGCTTQVETIPPPTSSAPTSSAPHQNPLPPPPAVSPPRASPPPVSNPDDLNTTNTNNSIITSTTNQPHNSTDSSNVSLTIQNNLQNDSQQSQVDTMTDVNDITLTKSAPEDGDMRYLFATVGELLEKAKHTNELTQQIPTLLSTITDFKMEIKKEISDLSARVLLMEEEVQKLRSFAFTKDGKSITMSNKSRISNLEDRIKGLEESTKAAAIVDADTTLAYNWDENRIAVLERQIHNLNATNTTPHWDETRISKLESQIGTAIETNTTNTWDENRVVDLEEQITLLKRDQNHFQPNSVERSSY